MMNIYFAALLTLLATAGSADPLTTDGKAIQLTPEKNLATYANSFDQPEGFAQTCFAVEGAPTWRREQWEDLVTPAGDAVIYKFAAGEPMATATLSFGAYGSSGWDIGVHASPDGENWTTLFTYDEETMGSGNRVHLARSLNEVLSPDRKTVYVKFAPAQRSMLVYDFALRATFGDARAVSHADEYQPGRVPPAGRMRYVINYGGAGLDLMDFLHDAWINFLHWHGPFSGYSGLPDHKSLKWQIQQCKETVHQAHENGSMIIFYVGPVFSYGDPEKRTQIFKMYDEQWEQYKDYLGERPGGDPLTWTQRDAEGNPIPYTWKGSHGYYLCTSNPATRQYVKGLLKLINACDADGVFYDGPAFRNAVCHCPHCVAGFRKYLATQFTLQRRQELFGFTDPSAVEPPTQDGTPLFIAWRRYHALALQDFLRDTRDSIRQTNPNFVMTANYCMWEGNPYGALRGSSEDLELWSQVLDVVFEEGCFDKTPRTDAGVKYSNAANYKYLLAACHGKPPTELAYMTKGATDEAQGNLARIAVAEALMGGGAWQVPYGQTNQFGRKAIAEYHAFQKANEDLLMGQTPYTNVGVLASMTQGYCGKPSYPMAMSRFLTDHQIDHRMVIDEELTAGPPAELTALVLPEAPCLSDAQIASLTTFAQDHRLVLIGSCGTHDEWGRQRQAPFADALRKSRRNITALPHVSLPPVGRKGIPGPAAEALSPILKVFEAVPPRVTLLADSSVEYSAYRSSRNRYVIHLVNFDVDLNGAVKDKGDLDLCVKLPPGYEPKVAELRSPDLDTIKLAPEVLDPGDGRELWLRLPRLHIYSIVVIEGAQTAPRADALRLQVNADRIIRLGGRAEFRLRLTVPPAMRGKKAQLSARGPEGSVVEPSGPATVSLRAGVVTKGYRLRAPRAAQVGDLIPVYFSVSVSGAAEAALSKKALVRLAPHADARLVAPEHLNMLTGTTRVLAIVKNLANDKMDAKVWFIAPEGWEFHPASERTKIEPGAQHAFAAVLSGPADAPGEVSLRARLSALAAGQLWLTDLRATASAETEFKGIVCPRASSRVQVDGEINERAWRVLQPIALAACKQDAPPSQATEAYATWDDTRLYFAFRCHERDMASVPANITDAGGEVWRDDDVEVFLDPQDAHLSYYHIAVNPLGTVYTNPDLPGVVAAASRSGSEWHVEIAIPLADLGSNVGAGTVWAFNLYRTRQPREGQDSPELSALFPTGAGFHAPQKFGHLVFEGARGES